jgi:ferrous iron transport protein B
MAISPSVPTVSQPPVALAARRIALAGNPNAGKTTLFNALTGLRQKVGNYPGVTVEKKEGRCRLPDNVEVTILDLPGTYSLSPKSPDEEIARDVLLGLRPETPVPDAIVIVVDASNLERNLYLATQVLELGIPSVIALNMTDVARANQKPIDAQSLSQSLGAPVVEMVASRGEGLRELRRVLVEDVPEPQPPSPDLPAPFEDVRRHLAETIDPENAASARPRGLALRLLTSDLPVATVRRQFGPLVAEALDEARRAEGFRAAAAGAGEVQARYTLLASIVERAIIHQKSRELSQSVTDRIDNVLTHRIWGLLIFALLTLLVFQAIFSWASIPMNWIDSGVAWLGTQIAAHMADGPLRDLLVEGVIAGVGAVVIFLPQILTLFFFIALLEDTGYMARAAFLMDRFMGSVGLHGRSFIPLLSSFACAIPGIMATRSISSRRDRMTTILIAPLMTCSARVPVYLLMIGAFIAPIRLWGVTFHLPLLGERYFGLTLPALMMFSLYVLGVLIAMAVAWVFKRTLFKGPPPALMLELPPYKVPIFRNVLMTMWDRSFAFLQRAGTVILSVSIVLWFLLSYPKPPAPAAVAASTAAASAPVAGTPANPAEDVAGEEAGRAVRYSVAGRVGHLLEPAIAPLGYNWKIGIGLIGAMAAREVFVSTMGTVYSVSEADETSQPLQEAMRQDRWPDGRPVWTTATVLSLLMWFVIAMQCISTLAVVRRETNGWKWPLFMQVYLTTLAWIAAFLTYHGAIWLGMG